MLLRNGGLLITDFPVCFGSDAHFFSVDRIGKREKRRRMLLINEELRLVLNFTAPFSIHEIDYRPVLVSRLFDFFFFLSVLPFGCCRVFKNGFCAYSVFLKMVPIGGQ